MYCYSLFLFFHSPVKFRYDLSNGLSCSSGGWDHILTCSTTITPFLQKIIIIIQPKVPLTPKISPRLMYLSTGSVNSLLSGCGGVDGGHETFNDGELVIDELCQRS